VKAAGDSAAINTALQAAGSISDNSSKADVQDNIDRFFRENPYAKTANKRTPQHE